MLVLYDGEFRDNSRVPPHTSAVLVSMMTDSLDKALPSLISPVQFVVKGNFI